MRRAWRVGVVASAALIAVTLGARASSTGAEPPPAVIPVRLAPAVAQVQSPGSAAAGDVTGRSSFGPRADGAAERVETRGPLGFLPPPAATLGRRHPGPEAAERMEAPATPLPVDALADEFARTGGP